MEGWKRLGKAGLKCQLEYSLICYSVKTRSEAMSGLTGIKYCYSFISQAGFTRSICVCIFWLNEQMLG